MKYKRIILFVFIISIFIPTNIYANNVLNIKIDNKNMQVNKVNVKVDGEILKVDYTAYTIDGRTFVPIRELTESLGAKVSWDNKTNSATIENKKQSIKMKIDSDVIYIDNVKNTISKDSIPKFATYSTPKYETKTMVPLRFLSETFGYSVSWDQESQTAIVTTKEAKLISQETSESKTNDKKEIKVDSKTGGKENSQKKAAALTINDTKNGIIVKPKKTDGFRSENELKQMKELDKAEQLVEPQKKRNISKTLKKKGKVTIVLDAGHGGKDSGGLSKDGYMEKVPTLKVAKRLSEKLKGKGYEVIMTRDSDVYIELLDRAGISNDSEAELFLSIHFNCSVNTEASGVETFYASEKTVGIKSVEQKPFAQEIQKAVISVTGAKSRGAKDGSSYLVLNKTNTVAALVELGFLSNLEELDKIKDDEYIDKLVEGVYQGINNYVDKYVE